MGQSVKVHKQKTRFKLTQDEAEQHETEQRVIIRWRVLIRRSPFLPMFKDANHVH